MYITDGTSSSLRTKIVRFATVALLAGILFNNVASSSPFERRQDDGIEPDDPSSDVDVPSGDPFFITEDKYPSLDDCRGKVSVDTDKSVFYSQVGLHEDKPQKFADEIGGKLLREAYPSGFTDKNNAYTGYPKFLQRASQAFAEKTSGTAHVLLPTDGSTDLSKKVWSKFEKPFLIADGATCNRIVKVDPDDFKKQCILWDRSAASDAAMPNCDKENGPIPGKFS